MSQYPCVSGLRILMHDVEGPPWQIVQDQAPRDVIRAAWIPQTLADQIWVLYEFQTETARLEWEQALTGHMKAWLSREVIPHALPYGYGSRDENGFERETSARMRAGVWGYPSAVTVWYCDSGDGYTSGYVTVRNPNAPEVWEVRMERYTLTTREQATREAKWIIVNGLWKAPPR